MFILNLISVTFWILIAWKSLDTLIHLKDQGFSRREVTAVTILLLCGLNISRGTILLIFGDHTGHLLLEYFYIGSSLFQLLLCNMVLHYIKNIK